MVTTLLMLRFESYAFGQDADPSVNSTDESPAEIEFNSAFLARTASGKPIDVSQFARGNPVYPGKYTVRLSVNDNPVGKVEVGFTATKDPLHAKPCFDRALLQQMGVDFSKLTVNQIADIDSPNTCKWLTELIPEASVDFDSSDQQMSVTIPQVFMRRTARGYVDPSLWDQGVTAGLLNYNANAYHSSYSGDGSTDLYLGLNAGVNIGRWRFRHNGSFSSGVGEQTHYQSSATYAEYAIVPWKSEIKLGDGYSDGTVFDSFGFRGVSLASDDRMLPDAQRGFAPVVRGIALSNAKVTVNQNGNLLYETTVPPGPFEINDLYATGYGGDLDVVVTESDGTKRSFAVPYSSVPQALRPGIYRYSVTAGQYRDQSLQFKSNVLAATYQRGLTNIVTLYGGVQFADRYGSVALGTALNTQFGALSGDVTVASTGLPGQSRQTGQSYQIRFAKLIPATDTNLTVAAYRYSTSGYLSLADAMMTRDYLENGRPDWSIDREKGRLQLSVSQDMGPKWGSLYLTGQSQNYWNNGDTDASFQFGYTNYIGRVSYNASISRTRVVSTGEWDNRVFVSFTVPLGSASSTASLTTNVSHSDTDHASQVQTTLSGTAGAHNDFSYSVSGSYDHSDSDSGAGGSASGSYASSVGTFGASVGAATHTQQYSLSASGGVILHGDGLTFGPPLGDTNALVEAKGAKGAYINGVSSNRINGFGYGIVASLSPYMLNRIEIDPKGLPLDVELKTTGQDIAPLAGAVVKTRFETDTRRTVVLTVTHPDGTPLAFGSEVTNREGISVGQVSQGGRMLARGVEETDELLVKWGSGAGESCTIAVRPERQGTGVCN
ncbi:Outer membrane usher protein HtrE [Pararobbsia alpina]|uniref:Outer membrane usher protein HtrE n=2 Tax=Pararobbsia alpina TaxID=621374 RepID=A0A6S7BB13_9BURK|nr:Outer membrane usher protein HtrE [Pararobbsia alpina]